MRAAHSNPGQSVTSSEKERPDALKKAENDWYLPNVGRVPLLIALCKPPGEKSQPDSRRRGGVVGASAEREILSSKIPALVSPRPVSL